MATLYVVSTESYTGKSAICLGLALRWRTQGRKPGYMKPVGLPTRRVNGARTDEDAWFIWRELDIEEPWEQACPVLLSQELVARPLSEERVDLSNRVVEAHKRLAASYMPLIVEGPASLLKGRSLGLHVPRLIELTGAKALLVNRYQDDLGLDAIVHVQDMLGDRLLGVIVNETPSHRGNAVKESLTPFLSRRGLQLFGVLLQDRLLTAISVGELADLLSARVLCAPEKLDELVENFLVGAMHVDAALKHFRRKPNKAVITGGDRADIQMAALDTSTRCLILTGNLYPSAPVLGRAAELGVPVLLVSHDTLTTTERVEQAVGRIYLSNARQVKHLEELVEEHIDLVGLETAIGM